MCIPLCCGLICCALAITQMVVVLGTWEGVQSPSLIAKQLCLRVQCYIGFCMMGTQCLFGILGALTGQGWIMGIGGCLSFAGLIAAIVFFWQMAILAFAASAADEVGGP